VSWIGIVLVVLCMWLALKVAGFALRLALWALVLCGLYWVFAPLLGLPRPF